VPSTRHCGQIMQLCRDLGASCQRLRPVAQVSYLVDSASSHELVSKIRRCIRVRLLSRATHIAKLSPSLFGEGVNARRKIKMKRKKSQEMTAKGKLCTRLGYDPIRIDPGSILDRITKDRAGLRGIARDRSRIDP
jgi:hypothetical protein